MANYDFAGYATRTNIRCADGRTIMPNAFKENDGQTVPLVWNHDHNSPESVLGHALLENRADGVYAYCKFNNTPSGQVAKECVDNGDIRSLSIYANKLKQNGGNVVHGMIREVSLVLAGANPQALIQTVISHSDDADEEAMIYTTSESPVELYHAEEAEKKSEEGDSKKMANEKTVQDVFDELTEEQKTVVYALIGEALSSNQNGSKEGEDMKHNVFEDEEMGGNDVLSHSDMEEIMKTAKRNGSLKEAVLDYCGEDVSVLSHADNYGVTPIDYLFPDAKNYSNTPDFIQRDMGWVSKVMNGVHHTPFSRIKSIHADITADEARALGYFKGNLKKEEVFTLLKRTTSPCTIYKKQKLDRDDVIDITDFDVVNWIKGEMRMMLNEELARAFLIGDGRLGSSDDKIKEDCIRPIMTDSDLYTIKAQVTVGADDAETAKNTIIAAVRTRKLYKGSGNPTFFTTEDFLTEALLLEDGIGHRLYKSPAEVAAAMRVSEIITVPVMENQVGPKGGELIGIAVNLNDYNVGADKGGAVSLFDDFDIDYNQQKYLIETRCSGAMVKPFGAMVFEKAV